MIDSQVGRIMSIIMIKSILLCCGSLLVLFIVVDRARCSETHQKSEVVQDSIRPLAFGQTLPKNTINGPSELVDKAQDQVFDTCQQIKSKRSTAATDNIQFDAGEFADQLKTWASNSGEQKRSDFVKSLAKQAIALAPTDYSVNVLHMNQAYEKHLHDTIFTKINWKNNVSFGVWIFQCGSFKNLGFRTDKHWAFDGPNYVKPGRNEVIFLNPDCVSPQFRYKNIFSAVEGNDLDSVKFFVEEKGNSVDSLDELGWSPLHFTALMDDLDIAKYLVDKKEANVNIMSDFEGWTPLHWASNINNTELVKFLLEKDAKYDVTDIKGRTPLNLAKRAGYTKVVQMLENHADSKIKRSADVFRLMEAAKVGNLADVKYFIEKKGISVDSDLYDRSPLISAATGGKLDIVRYLIEEKNANVTKRTPYGMTPLRAASRNGRLDVAKFLIDKGAYVDAQGCDSISPLDDAIIHNQISMVRYLVDSAKAKLNTRNCFVLTPLHYACKHGRLEILKFLIDRGADMNVPTNDGFSPLSLAAYKGHLDTVQYLVDEKKADLNVVDSERRTPLHWASARNYTNLAKFLLEKGAKLNVMDNEGNTPLDIAKEADNNVIIELIGNHFKDKISQMDKNIKHNIEDNTNFDTSLRDYKASNADIVVNTSRTKIDHSPNLFEAVEVGNLDDVKYFIEEEEIPVESRNVYGQTLLHKASLYGHLDIVKYLVVKKNANVNAKDDFGMTPLHKASSMNHIDMARFLINRGANKNARADAGLSPLILAAMYNCIDVVKCLVEERGVDINISDGGQRTPLHWAIENNHTDVVRFLLENDPKYDVKDSEGETALDLAIKANNTKVVDLLKKHAERVIKQSADIFVAAKTGNLAAIKFFIEDEGVQVELRDKAGWTPLHQASRHGHLDIVKYLIDDKKANFNAKNGYKSTPLYLASQEGHLEIVKFLVERGADINARSKGGSCPLQAATYNNQYDIVRFMIEEKKVDMNVIDDMMRTPLHWASERNHINLVRLLLSNDAKYDLKDNKGEIPLDLAKRTGNTEIVELLDDHAESKIQRSADIFEAAKVGNLDDIKFFTEKKGISVQSVDRIDVIPLHYAAYFGHLNVTRYLVLDKKADVNDSDRAGRTPLHHACLNGHLEVAIFLIDNGANIDARTMGGKSVLGLASLHNQIDIVRYLVNEKNADVNVLDDRLRTPLHYACQRDNKNVIQFLLKNGADLFLEDVNGQTPLGYDSCNTLDQ